MKELATKVFTVIHDLLDIKTQMNTVITFLLSAFSLSINYFDVFEFGFTAIISVLTIVLLFFKIKNEIKKNGHKN